MMRINDPTVYDPPPERLLRGAIGRRHSKWLRKVVVLSDGHRRHQTVLTDLGQFMLVVAGGVYAGSFPRLFGAPQED